MAFGKITEEEQGNTGFVKSNGVHTVELIRVGLSKRVNGSKGLVLTVKSEGSEFADTLYSFGDTNYAATYTKADGTKAKMCPRYVDSLAGIVGAEDDSTSFVSIPGKNGNTDVEVFTELTGTGVTIKVAVQMQYNEYYKEMKPTVVAVFDVDGFSVTELNKNATEPKQISLYDNVVDKGGKTETASATTKTAEEEADENF